MHAFVADYERYVTTLLSRDIPSPDLSTREPWTIPSSPSSPSSQAVVNPQALAQSAYRADWMLLEGKETLTARWRATMHIDLLPDWQGKGWGRRLIERFVASVRASGLDYGEGEHIGIAGENSKVGMSVSFFLFFSFSTKEKKT